MSTSEATYGGIVAASLASVVSQVDGSAFLTILVAVVLAIACAWITYRVAIREVKKEIQQAFAEHVKQMHADHAEMIQAVSDPAEKD